MRQEDVSPFYFKSANLWSREILAWFSWESLPHYFITIDKARI